jgi:4-amino-4-deoxy-L-arabinose transferase-like glycosyltransferase
LFLGTLPIAFLEASGTQNDLVAALFLLATASSFLSWYGTTGKTEALWTGVGLGLAMLTKGTAYFYAAPIVIIVSVLVLRERKREVFFSAVVMALTSTILNVGFISRNLSSFGTPLGSNHIVGSESHGVTDVLSTIARNIGSNLATPWTSINDKVVSLLTKAHAALGVNINDPKTSFPGFDFGLSHYINHEDIAPNPVHTILIMASFAIYIFVVFTPGKKRSDVLTRSIVKLYFVIVFLGIIIFCTMLRWQPWITRLQLPFFAMAAPFVAVVLTTKINRRFLAGIDAVMFSFALMLVFHNFTRPIFSTQLLPFIYSAPYSALVADRWQIMFGYRQDFRIVLQRGVEFAVKEGATTIGLAIEDRSYDYPVFGLAEEASGGKRIRFEHVCVPVNGTPSQSIRVDWVILYERPAPELLKCENDVFKKVNSFTAPSTDKAASDGVHVYRRVNTQ